jgi:UDP-N-acetylmuramate--alanine ligase
VVYLDDYAHHPTEIDSLIASLKMRYPNKKITGVFQPHLYSRTKDFATDFARSLSALNEVILLPIYPAREMPILGVTSDYLLELITNDTKKLISKEELVGCAEAFDSGVFVTIGAGDIDRFVQPIKDVFMNKQVKR